MRAASSIAVRHTNSSTVLCITPLYHSASWTPGGRRAFSAGSKASRPTSPISRRRSPSRRSSDTARRCATAITLAGAACSRSIDTSPSSPRSGATALNVIAALAGDQGRSVLRYSGPYPTEQLFITLLESFRYDPTTADPLAAFERGELDWHPAPHERVFTRGACVHLRERVEK